MMKPNFFLLMAVLFLCGCTISQKKQFEQVKVGMDKDQVLGILDSPQRTQRWHGLDRWTYVYFEEDQRYEKEVHFAEGRANYVGDIYVPEVSADQQDAINESSNRDLEAQLQARKEDSRKQYHQFEDQAHGTDAIRYVPQFTPIQ